MRAKCGRTQERVETGQRVNATVDEVAPNPSAWQDYQGAPVSVQRLFDKQVACWLRTFGTPRFGPRKYDQANDIWQAENQSDCDSIFKCMARVHDYRHHSSPQIIDA